jgi:hypothetical protein
MATLKGTVLAGAIAVFCATALAGGAARADLLDDIRKAKKIRIATDVAIPPSGMVDSAMKPTGSDVETAQLLSKDWGLELEFVQTTGATRIPNVQTNKADIIISTLSVTPDRARSLEHAGFRCREEAAGGERARVPSSVEELNRGSKVHGNLPAHPALGWMTERAIRHDEHGRRAAAHRCDSPRPAVASVAGSKVRLMPRRCAVVL